MKIRIGITGQNGFIGNHLYHTIRLLMEEFELVDFDRSWFDQDDALGAFVKQCDVIVHLAALNRHEVSGFIYESNISLVQKLIAALERTSSRPHLIFSSSIQEGWGNEYGKSKQEGRALLADWAERSGAAFTGLIIPNVFGPFAKPFHNSVIATFCHQIIHRQKPAIIEDKDLPLMYIDELVALIIDKIRLKENKSEHILNPSCFIKVSEALHLLENFHTEYWINGNIPELKNRFELNLFNTFRSYINLETYFPKTYIQHQDDRGVFSELIKLSNGGQLSYSTTFPGKIRGNHFHTRKIERFAIIKGEALMQLRRVGTDQVISLELKGVEPSYIDIPIWFTHNLKNIGEEELITVFWINECYNPDDADTYFEKV